MEIISNINFPFQKKIKIAKFSRKLNPPVGESIKDFSIIFDDDRIMVCVSGRKGSFELLNFLIKLPKKISKKFNFTTIILSKINPYFHWKSSNIILNLFKRFFDLVQK